MRETTKNIVRIVMASAMAMAMVLFTYVQSPAAGKGDNGKEVSIKGEVLDMNCYMAGEKHGAGHAQCAAMCIKGGAPMGILTDDNKVYLLTENHDKPDPYTELKSQAAKQVTVKGTMFERGGVQGIEVSSVETE